METETQMMVVHQNILSTIMLKNDELSIGNVSLHLATPEICQVIKSSINSRIQHYLIKMFAVAMNLCSNIENLEELLFPLLFLSAHHRADNIFM